MHPPPPFVPPDVAEIPWYGADRTLPASRFIPGRDPRPEQLRNAPDIHQPWTPEQWRTLQAYLRGTDLFNRWYYWEAHESWEPLWRAHPPQSDPARFIQGLISAAAALLKHRMGNARSAQTLLEAACERLSPFQGIWMGLSVETFRTDMDRYLASITAETSRPFSPETPRMRLSAIA